MMHNSLGSAMSEYFRLALSLSKKVEAGYLSITRRSQIVQHRTEKLDGYLKYLRWHVGFGGATGEFIRSA